MPAAATRSSSAIEPDHPPLAVEREPEDRGDLRDSRRSAARREGMYAMLHPPGPEGDWKYRGTASMVRSCRGSLGSIRESIPATATPCTPVKSQKSTAAVRPLTTPGPSAVTSLCTPPDAAMSWRTRSVW